MHGEAYICTVRYMHTVLHAYTCVGPSKVVVWHGNCNSMVAAELGPGGSGLHNASAPILRLLLPGEKGAYIYMRGWYLANRGVVPRYVQSVRAASST